VLDWQGWWRRTRNGDARRPLLAALAALLLLPAGAWAHAVGAGITGVEPDMAAAQIAMREVRAATPGPCTAAAAKAFRAHDDGDDHSRVEDHKGLACRLEQVFFSDLRTELAARPDVVLGEMDIKAGIAVVATIYPEGGFLVFDVKHPAKPVFKSWYRGMACEGVILALNCGAYVDLTADGRTAVLSVQTLTGLPYPSVQPALRPVAERGIELVDLTDPARPSLRQVLPVASVAGVHTARTHVHPNGKEYIYSAGLMTGVEIAELVPTPAGPIARPVARLVAPDLHDTFTQTDPIDGRTYLYLADGLGSGFQVYDVSDPSMPRPIAMWDLTPECTQDWFGHTIDVTHRGDRRIVTLGVEQELLGNSTPADRAKGCGDINGNGDKPGPLWFVDASDWSDLAPVGAPDAEQKAKSEKALITTWTNPAAKAGGRYTFSPHNQQIVGDKVYLSHYHGGVFVLDASGAFAGRDERPRELAHIVPSGEASTAAARPMLRPGTPFAIPLTRGRSSIWDVVFHDGHLFAADQVGGLYSLREVDR